MRLFIICSIIAFAKAGVIIENTSCDDVEINGVFHERELIKEDLDRPYMLAVDYSTNTLYFSYSIKEHDDEFKTARIELSDNSFNDLDIVNGFAQTVDQENNNVYVGSNDGIYKYDHDSDKAEFIGLRGSDIWAIFFKDVLYYSEFPSQFLFTYINGSVVRFKDLEDTKVDHFLIDNEDNMFYTNASGLYSQKKGTKDAVFYSDFPLVAPRGLTTDKNGNVYVCLQDGIYSVDKVANQLKEVAPVEDCFGIAFDNNNNIIYADSQSIKRLKPIETNSCQNDMDAQTQS